MTQFMKLLLAGTIADDLRRELACRRAELETVREKLLDRLRRLR
jgi:hypothetical protein